ncbi:MAG: deoxyguanosinetriphosphate triphosphohydrolase [Verrucomicrobiota bacterium]
MNLDETVRKRLEAAELAVLAPFAQKTGETAGRLHPEPPHPHRTAFQRDRARVIHSRSFRRLEYKTQVFLNGTGDHLRNRLTHTIEVASVSRSLASTLGVNENLAEVIALAHDLGHAPFGHAGEEELDRLMEGQGGFEHNLQSLRIVEKIEAVYPNFDGLNLSYEVLEGLRKHEASYERLHPETGQREAFQQTSLEGQIANRADEITYYSHDLDDGIAHGFLLPEQLEELEIWRKCARFVQKHFPHLEGRRFQRYVVRSLIDYEVAEVLHESSRRIQEAGVETSDEVRRFPKPLIAYSQEQTEMNRELRRFLFQYFYYHPEVQGANDRGCDMLRRVFQFYLHHPERLGETTRRRLEEQGLERTVCDYVSGMTDRYLMQRYNEIDL